MEQSLDSPRHSLYPMSWKTKLIIEALSIFETDEFFTFKKANLSGDPANLQLWK